MERKLGTSPVAKGAIIQCTATVILPANATRDEVDEWISFSLNYRRSMKMNNPLENYDLDCVSVDLRELTRGAR